MSPTGRYSRFHEGFHLIRREVWVTWVESKTSSTRRSRLLCIQEQLHRQLLGSHLSIYPGFYLKLVASEQTTHRQDGSVIHPPTEMSAVQHEPALLWHTSPPVYCFYSLRRPTIAPRRDSARVRHEHHYSLFTFDFRPRDGRASRICLSTVA